MKFSDYLKSTITDTTADFDSTTYIKSISVESKDIVDIISNSLTENNKAIYVLGAPGSGKDLIVKIAKEKLNLVEYTLDNIKLVDSSIIISDSSIEYDKVKNTKAFLESNDYETMLIIVDITNETSKYRNENRKSGSRMISEDVRYNKWKISQQNIKKYKSLFEDIIVVDNNTDKEIAMPTISEMVNKFITRHTINESIDDKFQELFETTKIQHNTAINSQIGSLKDRKNRLDKRINDSIKRLKSAMRKEDVNKDSDEALEQLKEKTPGQVAKKPVEKSARTVIKTDSYSPTYDIRASGLGIHNSPITVESDNRFLKHFKEAIDSPNLDSPVTGAAGSATNTENMQRYSDNIPETKKRRKLK